MFWNLLLAHLIGDFLLQTEWMVKNRNKFWVLTLHVSIHFGLMLLLIGESRSEHWPLITLLALIHMGQDSLKISLVQKMPGRSFAAFVLDQILHVVIIGIFIWVFRMGGGTLLISQKIAWVMIAIAFLFVTYVWFISERVFYSSKPDYVLNINNTKFSRMITRASMVSAFLLGRAWAIPSLAMILTNPYTPSKYRQRALLTDVSISIIAIIFLFWALG